MKFLKYSLLAVVAASGFAFSACSDDDNEYQPGPQSEGVFFFNDNASRLQLPTNATELSITVGREGSTAEASYPVQVSTNLPEGIFNFPAEVHFAQGENVATYTATCQLPEESTDRNYSLELSFPNEVAVCDYGERSLAMRLTLLMKKEAFEHYGTALIVDAWITAAYNFTGVDGSSLTYEDLAWEVNLNASLDNPGVYQLEDAWTCDDAPTTITGINVNAKEGADGEMHCSNHENIRIDASDPNFVLIPAQYSGVTWVNQNSGPNPTPVYIGNAAPVLLAQNTKEEIIAAGRNTVLQEDGLMEISPALFGWDDGDEFGYSWNGSPTGIIQFYEGQTLEPSSVRSMHRRQKALDTYKVVNMKRALGFRSL